MADSVQKVSSIVVGTSLEIGSDPVVATSVDIARGCGAPLHLFHAHDLPTVFIGASAGLAAVTPDLLSSEREVRCRLLDEQLDRLGLERSTIAGVTVEAGAVHRMLLETARREKADLLVLGARETDRLSWLGSTVDRVLRQAECPVWVIDGAPRMPPRRVLAPVDLSPLALGSLRRGLQVLDQLGGEPPAVELLFVLTAKEIERSQQFDSAAIHRMAEEELERFAAKLDPSGGGRLTREVRRGDEVRDEIVKEASGGDFDLVILATHGRSGFDRFLLGSVAADVASRCEVSSLIVPPGREDQGA
ncbi:MAG: universal stress protein [Acidobacteriota bacterium]